MQERRAHPPADRHDLEGLVRHAALAAFAALCILLRLPQLLAAHAELKLEIETWASALLVTFVMWHTGGAESPLQSLYLLPIVLAALVLPPQRLAALLLAITAAYVLLAARRSGLDIATAAFAGRALSVIGPLVVVAWLTAQLGTAVLAARRHATALVDADALTGLAQRRVLLAALQPELSGGARRAQPCALLVIDIDGQGRLNEQYGNEAGNAVLQLVADILRRALRETDLAARWGGDEFAVLLPGADLAAAQATARRIRNAVNAATLSIATRVVRATISIGAATSPRDARDAQALVAAAERRLQQDRELRRAPGGSAAAVG